MAAILIKMAEMQATAQGVDPNLVKAIIHTESAWNPVVSRYEPHWKYLHFPRVHAERLGITPDTETVLQSMSIGLMQIMGGVARELGFMGNLSELFEPGLNLEYGIKKLRSLVKKYADESEVISSYNQGSPRRLPGGLFENQAYVDKVWKELSRLRLIESMGR